MSQGNGKGEGFWFTVQATGFVGAFLLTSHKVLFFTAGMAGLLIFLLQ